MGLSKHPFDQYQRYRAVTELLAVAPGDPPERVLEVGGGGESLLAEMLPGTQVTVADIEWREERADVRRVQADAQRPLPFRDRSFPAAITIDTLEHLPREARPGVLRELRRVARGLLVVACPVADHGATAAELTLDQCYRAVFGHPHRWLADHREHGLPAAHDIESILDSLGGAWRRECNGYLPEWQSLMLFHLLFDGLPGGAFAVPAVRAVDAYYNERLYPFSNRPPAYRMVWVHAPEVTLLPSAKPWPSGAAPAADRDELERRMNEASAALPTDGERTLARVQRLQHRVAELEQEHALVAADRHRIDLRQLEVLAECERLRDDRDRLEMHQRAWIAECEHLQRTYQALLADRNYLAGDRQRLLDEVRDLHWRLHRLGLLDRAVDRIAPVVRPVIAPLRRRLHPPPAEPDPYGAEIQASLTRSPPRPGVNGGPARAPLTVLLCVPPGDVTGAVARTRASLASQTVPPLAVREVPSERVEVGDHPEGTHLALVCAGDRLAPNACAEIAHALAEHPDATAVYTDEDEWPPEGRRRHPRLKPGWDPELARAAGYLGSLACFRSDLLGRVPAGLTASEVAYALTLAAAEHADELGLHVPLVLCHGDPVNRRRGHVDPANPAARALLETHLRRCGDDGEVLPAGPGLEVRRAVDPATRATIIIPYRDGPDLTARCVDSVRAHTCHPSWEILFVDNRSTDPRAEALVTGLVAQEPERMRLLRYPLPYNFSAMNNLAAREARGEVLVLLNNDTEILTDGWLEQLMGLANRPGVGAVGTLLLFPDGRIQHCGIVLGMGSWPGRAHGVAAPLLRGCMPEEVDPLLWAYDRRSGAVTAACVAVRRDRYLAVGGLDETLRNDFNDVDFCLKLAASGLKNLYTPHVRVTHHEAATRSYRALDGHEVDVIFARWADRLAADPHVSPHLDRTTLHPAFAMASLTGAGWPGPRC